MVLKVPLKIYHILRCINYCNVSYGARHKNAVMWMKSLMCGHSNQMSLIILAVTCYKLLFWGVL